MATDKSTVDFIVDQISEAGTVAVKKMFGEYTVYVDGKAAALICDNRFYVKPTAAGRAYIGDAAEASPYPGAKPCFLIEDRVDDREWLTGLFRVTAKELPEPKPKKRK